MYIIEANKQKNSWISGIFEDEEKAQKYFESISVELREHQHIERIETIKFPFYIIEENREFKYINYDEVHELFESLDLIEDEDHVYFNLYFVIKDYQPKIPGTDSMGIINHLHIDNSFLKHYQTQEKNILTRNRMA